MNLAVTQDPRDHDHTKQRVVQLLSQLNHMDLYPKVQTLNIFYNVNVILNKFLYKNCLLFKMYI